MEIYIHKDDKEFGPYSRETALEYVNQGAFHPTDWGWHAGAPDWKTLGELLEIDSDVQPPSSLAPQASAFPPVSAQPQRPAPMQYRKPASRKITAPIPEKSRAFMIFVNVLLALAIVTASYIRFGNGGKVVRRYLAPIWPALAVQADEPAPQAPTPAPLFNPITIQKPVEAPAPPPAATPTPAPPKAFTIADLAGNPGAWPKTLRLKQSASFPAVFNSQVVGSVTVPQGTEVTLVNIQGDELTLTYQGGTRTLPWQQTDIEERVKRAAAP